MQNSKYVAIKDGRLTKKIQKMFGKASNNKSIVKAVYVANQLWVDINSHRRSLKLQSKNTEVSDNFISFSSGGYIIEFVTGNRILLTNSEWMSITALDNKDTVVSI